MGLSNTATPRYYGEFREAVMAGEIPVCEEISLEMNRIDKLIKNPHIYYDEGAVEGFIEFCEGELTLTDGSPLKLLFTYKLWSEQIFGWWYFIEKKIFERMPDDHPLGNTGGHWVKKKVKKRLVNKQYLIVARGAAKSLYESCLQAYFLVCDLSTTKQITTAPTMRQAEEIMSPIRTAITRAPGPVFKFLTEGSAQNTTGNRALRQKLVPTKKGVENFTTSSILEVRPMSIDKLQGLRTKCNTVDEWLSGDVREDVIGAIQQGAGKVPDYLIVAVSSEGTVRHGPGDDVKMELMKYLRQEVEALNVSIWHYKLDSIDEVAHPELWVKANPNIGITIPEEEYHLDVERMEASPSTQNDILAKRFGLPMSGFSFFFSYEETLPTSRHSVFWQHPCALGADLSMGDDFCAFTFLFPLSRDRFGLKTRSYITKLTLDKLPIALRSKYQEFIDEDSLVIMEGNILDVEGEVFDDLYEHIMQNQYDVRALGYDPYNAAEFVKRYQQTFGPYNVEKVIQGAKTESVPLGEMKTLTEERLIIFDQSLMSWTMGNCIVELDNNGNRKLLKQRYDDKIDNVSAWMDAFIVWKLHKEAFE